MTSSLVGSEMCIRDRSRGAGAIPWRLGGARGLATGAQGAVVTVLICEPVSYTHLTLPTICSV
eukprot:701573-Prorocentrum_lima.AAC.1